MTSLLSAERGYLDSNAASVMSCVVSCGEVAPQRIHGVIEFMTMVLSLIVIPAAREIFVI